MIRLALDEDTQQIKDLWAYCFNDTPEFMDFYFSSCYQPDNTLVVVDEGRVQSSLQLLSYKIQMRGKPSDVCYIVGVATWPEYRGRGHAAELIRQAIKVMLERGIYISILLPFQYDFYRKYGWEVCYSFLTYRNFDFSLPKVNLRNKIYVHIDITDHLDDINDCYTKFVKQFNGYVIRNENDWSKILTDVELDNGRGYLLKENGNPKGYILYTIQDNVLRIVELIYADAETKSVLLHLALSHKGQVDQVLWKAPLTDKTYLLMKDSRGYIEKEAFVMGRILNVEEALTGLQCGSGTIRIKINDNFYSENNKCFRIEGNGNLTVQSTDNKPQAEMTIQTLSQLLWGYIDITGAIYDGLIQCYDENTAEILSSLLPQQKTFMIEEY